MALLTRFHCNSKMGKFTQWSKQHYPSVHLISDGYTHNDNKMGVDLCPTKEASNLPDLDNLIEQSVPHSQ